MTTIKCKHLYAICCADYGSECKYCNFSEWGNWGGNCDYYISPKEINFHADPNDKRIDVDECCGYMDFRERRFGKSVKNYEYDEYGLTIGKTFIPAGAITYLEIDGEILKGGDK